MDCRVKPGNDDVKDRSRGAYFLRPSFAHHAKRKFPPQIRSSSDDIRPWITGCITIGAALVARMKRSEIQDRHSRFLVLPGLRFASSGLPKRK